MFKEEHVIYRYKYLPFSEGSLKTLADGTIKFTSPIEFNDPFDCLPYYDTTNIQQVTRARADLFKAYCKEKGLSPANRLGERHRFTTRIKNNIENGSFAINTLKNVGVVSLSKNALSIPMWSHYADFHRGLVLEFRIPIMGTKEDLSISTDRLLPFPVRYSENRPRIDFITNNSKNIVNDIALTKSLDWAYEEEERVIDNERGPGIYKYRRDEILCSVIAGLKIREDNYRILQEQVNHLAQSTIPNLMLYKACSKKNEYKLEVKDHPRLAISEITTETSK